MLTPRLLAYRNYFENLATQPPNHWEGFYFAQYENRHAALHFQIAFACYALGVLCLHPEADQETKERCHTAMKALIERMMQRRVWAYWALPAERKGEWPDPVEKDNVQYSGHLAMMIGLFEAATGDTCYDVDPFILLWSNKERFSYTHTTLVEALCEQMEKNDHHGIDNEPGRTEIAHMNAALWATALHDGLHSTTYSAVNDAWVTFVKQKMLVHGPRKLGRGVFCTTYMSHLKVPIKVSLNIVDAWTLAFLSLLYPDLTRQLAPRFMSCVRYVSHPNNAMSSPATQYPIAESSDLHSSVGQAYVPSAPIWRSREISDLSLTTGFAYLLAVHMGDISLASSLLNYADSQLKLVEVKGERFYYGGMAVPFTTALFAIGEAGGLLALRDFVRSQKAPSVVPETVTEECAGQKEGEENTGPGEDMV